MSMLNSLRNGLKFFLMSLGISSPAKKPQNPSKPASKPGAGK
jgi:hypothetical protein